MPQISAILLEKVTRNSYCLGNGAMANDHINMQLIVMLWHQYSILEDSCLDLCITKDGKRVHIIPSKKSMVAWTITAWFHRLWITRHHGPLAFWGCCSSQQSCINAYWIFCRLHGACMFLWRRVTQVVALSCLVYCRHINWRVISAYGPGETRAPIDADAIICTS